MNGSTRHSLATQDQASSHLSRWRLAALSLVASTALACGGSTSNPGNPGNGDEGNAGGDSGAGGNAMHDAGGLGETDSGASGNSMDAGAASDANQGMASSTYPAFKVDVAQISSNGGHVLTAPVVVTVTWSSDTQAATWNALGDAIGPSSYWHTINGEYGVGPATSGTANHVSITTTAPAQMSDQDLDTLVSQHAASDWPKPTANTIYAVYLAPTTTLYFGGLPDAGGQDVCQQGVGGYHSTTQSGNYVYAIMPQCQGFQAGDIEMAATHELNEAATDPSGGGGYVGFDNNHLAFEFFNQFQDELGDACESYKETTDTTDFTPYTAQRQWSNKSAAAGSHWCLPALNEPFYNTTFLIGEPAGIPTTQLDDITVNLSALGMGAGSATSKGFKMALNTTRTFPIGYFSDANTNGPFTLDVQWPPMSILAQDMNGNNITNGTATVTIDKTSGVNGDIANVTVSPTAYSSMGVTFFYIRAVLPNALQRHYLPVLLSQN
jgi:hypothetical protein